MSLAVSQSNKNENSQELKLFVGEEINFQNQPVKIVLNLP